MTYHIACTALMLLFLSSPLLIVGGMEITYRIQRRS